MRRSLFLLTFLVLGSLRVNADTCPAGTFNCFDGLVLRVLADGISTVPAQGFSVRADEVDERGIVLRSFTSSTDNNGHYQFNPVTGPMPFPGAKLRVYAWHDGIRWGNQHANPRFYTLGFCNNLWINCLWLGAVSGANPIYSYPSPLQVDRVEPSENQFVHTGGCDDTYSWTDAVDASRRNPTWPVRYSFYGDGVELHDLTERQVSAALQECGYVVWQIVASMEVWSTNLDGTRVWQETASPFFVNPAQCCEVWHLE